MFAIAPTTGALYTLSSLDHETGAAHFLSIVARDSGAPTQLTAYTKVKVIIVDVNDHAPIISVHALASTGGGGATGAGSGAGADQVQVQEGAGAGTFIAKISVEDPDSGDNGRFSCSLNSPLFSLQPLTVSEFKLLTTQPADFDRERQDTHQVALTCTDKGTVSQSTRKIITVRILDTNDHSPVFELSHYEAEITENNVVGTYVTRVNATDADIEQNARILYSIESLNNSPSVLSIQPGTGIVTALQSLDYEQQASYQFKVIATDQGQPPRSTHTTLTLQVKDSNDNPPVFQRGSYAFGTFENQPVGTEITTLQAFDADGPPFNHITYSIDRQNPDSSKFHIDPHSGKLTTKRILDREEQGEFYLKIYASNEDYYLTSTVNLTIHVADKNDNAPLILFPSERNNTVHFSMNREIFS